MKYLLVKLYDTQSLLQQKCKWEKSWDKNAESWVSAEAHVCQFYTHGAARLSWRDDWFALLKILQFIVHRHCHKIQ